VGLPITVGVARTKFLAKVASGVAKPDGLLAVEPDGVRAFLDPLPIARIWGVGPVAEARLPPGKTLDTFDFETVPMLSKAQVMAITAGDSWLAKGANLLLFGPPGGGKSHLAAAIGLALIDNGARVLFTRTTDLVQKLQVARRELALEAAINRLDRFHLLILDDLAYVSKDQAETSVLFELISARYERRSVLITANQPFGEWGKIFPDPAMTLAVVDRLVHHATIFEMNVESYRRRTALERKRGPGRPPSRATPNTVTD
jgi:DNA replication protein DnaC